MNKVTKEKLHPFGIKSQLPNQEKTLCSLSDCPEKQDYEKNGATQNGTPRSPVTVKVG